MFDNQLELVPSQHRQIEAMSAGSYEVADVDSENLRP